MEESIVHTHVFSDSSTDRVPVPTAETSGSGSRQVLQAARLPTLLQSINKRHKGFKDLLRSISKRHKGLEALLQSINKRHKGVKAPT